MLNCKKIASTTDENNVLDRLDGAYLQYSEMMDDKRKFLNSLLLRSRPKKVLELGISSGASSVLIANALKDFGGKLYSVDVLKNYYVEPEKPCGFLVNEYPELKEITVQYLGGMAHDFIDKIGDGIDFAFIDTRHTLPGEVLDFLIIYPYLKQDAYVVFHDTSLNLSAGVSALAGETSYATLLCCSGITGEKLQPVIDFTKHPACDIPHPNTTGIKLTKETGERLFEVFILLACTWAYNFPDEQSASIASHLSRIYPDEAVSFFRRVNEFQNLRFSRRYLEVQQLAKLPTEGASFYELQSRIAELAAQMNYYQNSFSWRITKPIRAIKRLIS